ncbi:MAG TPA: hypothetical protein IAA98_02640 [Candidatus Avipropionibacterium avicola]|uniref:Uncharacterized protein n=1 Tax=Candidatus Avipropionibacterium avicola TaxID=2840701 RepID=A0A9D1KM74_9ACTN|nr:hypothetical protein [Candidatus Avipropionibacterium avicola]
MGAYWRGEITLRKLRVLAQGLPPSGPHTRHETNGVEYDYLHALLWALQWAVMENTVVTAQAAGDKKAKMPADHMPRFPWEKPKGQHDMGGDLGDNDQEEVLDFLADL